MSALPIIALAPLGVVFIAVFSLSIVEVRREHPHHVHTLWYLFSLTFCLVSVLFFYIHKNAGAIQDTFLSGTIGNLVVVFMHASMDVREEIYILGTISALLILPQILSYIISGIYGCGSPPVLVSTVSKIAIWSLIKFFCVLSGILAAQGIFALYGDPYLHPRDAPPKAVEALLMIALSFSIMAVYYRKDSLRVFFSKYSRLRRFESLSRYMTRYREGAGAAERRSREKPLDHTAN